MTITRRKKKVDPNAMDIGFVSKISRTLSKKKRKRMKKLSARLAKHHGIFRGQF